MDREERKVYPKLREIDIFPAEVSGHKVICLRDPLNLSGRILFVPPPTFYLISLFDGKHSRIDLQAEFMRHFGELLFQEKVQEVIDQLDAHFLLENERFQTMARQIYEDFRKSTVRNLNLSGEAYESEPERIRETLLEYFREPEGPGYPRAFRSAEDLVGAIAPHIDYRRGGSCYAWAHKALRESCNADLFLILGTAHASTKMPFTLTRKHFETPWGIVETDQEFLSEVEKAGGLGFYDDEFVHKGEHSIELQLVFLRALWEKKNPPKIVPILCGSFHEAIRTDRSPLELPGVGKFLDAIRAAMTANKKKICILASADLAHVGLRFGDPDPPNSLTLSLLGEEDQRMLKFVEGLDAEGFFGFLKREKDRRRICGFSPIYTLLHLIRAREGRLLKYGQSMEPNSQSVVTFASLAYYA